MARVALDRRLDEIRETSRFTPPRAGWVRAIRDALGMSARQLGERLGVTAQSVQDIEKSEKAGTVKLETLQRAAAALGCEVVYAFVPKVSLDEMVETRARARAASHSARIARTMELEAQAAGTADLDLETMERDPGLWDGETGR